MIDKRVKETMLKISARKLKNNTQRALLALLKANGEWVSRRSLRIPSVAARLRDLRKEQYGEFEVVCNVTSRRNPFKNKKSTYYRINPRSVTLNRVLKVFEGVI